MIPLPIRKRKNGFSYTLIRRGYRSVIYEQEGPESMKYYEVFLIRTRSERVLRGKIMKERERFPNDEAFGSWAWSYWTLEEAQIKFNELES